MRNFLYTGLIWLLLLPELAAANPVKVVGRVTDTKGIPMPGVSVAVRGTGRGVTTDAEGHYALTGVPANATLVFTFVGMRRQEVALKGRTTLDVVLEPADAQLDELVVVGFGSQSKSNITGAVSSVSMEKILGNRPVTNAINALQGTIPGLVISGGSSPGQSKSFNIRGVTSINGGGPLVLVDNVPAEIDMINPEDIEEVTILKDAASSAIYGARAAFGVILVTTKRGKKNSPPQLRYENSFGIQRSINKPEQADIVDILRAYQDAQFTGGKWFAQSQDIEQWIGYINSYRQSPSQLEGVTANGIYIPKENNPAGVRYYLKETDLYQNMLADYGLLQSHNVSVMGGSDKISYRTSLGYNNDQGILVTDKDSYNRLTLSSYVSSDLTPWLRQAVDVKYSRGKKSWVSSGSLWDLRLANFIPEGEATSLNGNLLPLNTPKNYVLYTYPTRSVSENPRIYSQTTVTPFKGLTGVLEVTFDRNVYDMKDYNRPFTVTSVQLEEKRTPQYSSYTNTKQATDYSSINAYATYEASLGTRHNLKVMAGYSQEQRRFESLNVEKKEMINEDMPSFTGAYGETIAKDQLRNYAIRSGFYRINYSYMDRYMVEANGRYDGSSKFPRRSRFGFFPSFSAGWQLGREPFMEWSKPVLTSLKLRGSWGEIGNQAIAEYGFIPTMDSFLSDWINPATGLRPTSLSMPGLVRTSYTWEKMRTLDVGFNTSLFRNRLQVDFSWYRRETIGMLTPGMELPAAVGAAAPQQNAANLQTSGWELNVGWNDQIKDWRYSVNFNIYDSQSLITKFDNAAGLLGNYRKGMIMGEIWGYVSDGFYTADDFSNTQSWTLKPGVPSIKGVSVRPGDIKFRNLSDAEGAVPNEINDGNNTLSNPGDRRVIGNNTLRYIYGASVSVGWKGFDLFALVQGTGKRDVWISDDLRWPFATGNFGTLFSNQKSYWKPTDITKGDWRPVDPNPEFPRIYDENGNAGSNRRVQTRYLLSGAYMRLKNVTLGYTLPREWSKRVAMERIKVFVSGENLYTWDSLPQGYDPERLSWQYPFYLTLSFGVNVTL